MSKRIGSTLRTTLRPLREGRPERSPAPKKEGCHEILKIGQRVIVNVEGLETSGIVLGAGIRVAGVIVDINANKQIVTVQMDFSIDGRNKVEVPAVRVRDNSIGCSVSPHSGQSGLCMSQDIVDALK